MNRTPFQGVINIIRFNPVMFIVSGVLVLLGLVFFLLASGWLAFLIMLGVLGAVFSIVVSLGVSHWIYDRSSVYELTFLDDAEDSADNCWVNINAGFDEISEMIEEKFPLTKLHVLDFYDPSLHTEASIARARKAYPPHPSTVTIQCDSLPMSDDSVDKVIGFFSLHEIRDHDERVTALKEIRNKLADGGKLYITEHLRDAWNLCIYSLGSFHFHTRSEWLKTFEESGFQIKDETKITPFITTFTVIKS